MGAGATSLANVAKFISNRRRAPAIERTPGKPIKALSYELAQCSVSPAKGDKTMSLGTILVILLIIFLLGGFSGRFGGYGYGYGHGGIGILGTILIIVVVLMLLGRI